MKIRSWLAFSLLNCAYADTLLLTPDEGARTETVIASGLALDAAGTLAGISDPLAILVSPQAAKIYAVGRGPSDGIAVFDLSGRTLLRRVSLPASVTSAALSPDGARLAVAMDLLRVLDTASDSFVNASPLNSPLSAMAYSADSMRLYGIGARFTVFDAASLAPLGSSEETMDPPGHIVVSPLGRVFATSGNRIYEFDPRSAARRNLWQLAGNLRQPLLSADAQRIFLPMTNSPGPALGVLPLAAGFLAQYSNQDGAGFSQVFQIGPSRLLAVSTGPVRTLYQIDLDAVRLERYTPAAQAGMNEVTSAAVTPDALYAADNGRLRRISLDTGRVSEPGALLPFPPSSIRVLPPSLGAPAASLTALNPAQTLLARSVSAPLTLRALDARGRPAAGARIRFSTSNPLAALSSETATANSDGIASTTVFTPAAPGTLTVEASAETTAAPARFRLGIVNEFIQPGISAAEGNGILVDDLEPRTVAAQVLDASGSPAAGQTVNWRIVSGAGSIGSIASATDASGIARLTFTPSEMEDPGEYLRTIVLEARFGANTARFTLTQLRGAFPPGVCIGAAYPPPRYTLIAPETRRLTGRAGETLRGAIRVAVEAPAGCANFNDPIMAPVANIAVRIAPGAPASCAGGAVFTSGSNPASCDVVFGGSAGTGVLNLLVGGEPSSLSVEAEVLPGPPSAVRPAAGAAQSARPNEALPATLTALVTDGFGNPVPGVPVRFHAPPAITLNQTSAVSSFDGRAAVNGTLGAASAPQTVRASVSGSSPASFLVTPAIPAASLRITGGDNQTTLPGEEFPRLLEIDVLDASGAPVRGAIVNFRVRSGPAVLPAYTATASEQGKALLAVRAAHELGAATVEASVGAATALFTLNVSATPVQPALTREGVLNEASRLPGPLAAGTVVRIVGAQLGPKEPVSAALTPEGRLATTLAGVRVLWDGNPSPLLSVQENAITAVVPYVLGAGAVSLAVETEFGRTPPVPIEIRIASPAIFPGLVFNADFTRNSSAQPSPAGREFVFYATGGGQTDPPSTDGKLGAPPLERLPEAEVWVNGVRCELIYAGAAPGAVAGYTQVVARLPESLPRGQPLPLEFRSQGAASPPGPVIHIAP
jgi:uncharacterized protein (TIGR03437 family)